METKQQAEREQQEMEIKQMGESEQSDTSDNTTGEDIYTDKRKILERIWTFCLKHKLLSSLAAIFGILASIATFYTAFLSNSSDPEDKNGLNATAGKALMSGELEIVAETLKKDGESPYALVIDKAIVAAHSLHQNGRIDDSIEKWNCIAIISEEIDNELSAIALFLVGNLYSEKQEAAKSISFYNDAIRLRRDFVDAYINRGNMKIQLGDYKDAIDDYSDAIDLKPDSAIAYYNRGLTYLLLNKRQKASLDFGKANDLKPNLSKTYTNRGNLYSQIGDYKNAIDDYSDAIDLKPDSVDAYFNRGYARYQLGKYQEAASDYTVVIGQKPYYAKAYANLGAAKAAMGNIEGAKKNLQIALRLSKVQGDENMKSETVRLIQELNKMESSKSEKNRNQLLKLVK